MLFSLILCAVIQRLHGSPSQSTVVSRRDAPEDSVPQSRSEFDIVSSCLLTIFACVWTALHPNINGPRDSGWTCFKRKLTTALFALIAPELILYWAMKQRSSAKEIARRYNAEFARFAEPESSLWSWFQPLPKSTTRRGSGQPWTTTHGFFVQMGGFLLYENEYPTEVLDYERLAQLMRRKLIDRPIVTHHDLQDRSKGDAISKGVVVWQTTWFALQCCARLAQHLPLSELEVVTLAFAVVNGAIYAAWWDKPQGVDVAICVPLKGSDSASTADDAVPDPDPAAVDDAQYAKLPLTPLPDEPALKHEGWLRRTLRTDHERYTLPVFLFFCLPYRIVSFAGRPFAKAGDSDTFNPKNLRIPMFYARQTDSYVPSMILMLVGLVFGAVHLLSWSSPFPSHLDQVLWRISTVVMMAAPVLGLISISLDLYLKLGIRKRNFEQHNPIVLFLDSVLIVLLYTPARAVVIIVALKAMHNPPDDVLLDISWTSYIPHF